MYGRLPVSLQAKLARQKLHFHWDYFVANKLQQPELDRRDLEWLLEQRSHFCVRVTDEGLVLKGFICTEDAIYFMLSLIRTLQIKLIDLVVIHELESLFDQILLHFTQEEQQEEHEPLDID